jgi:hypothetical protein
MRYISAACHRTVSCARGSSDTPSRPYLVVLSPDWQRVARKKRRWVGWVSGYQSLSLLCVRHGTNAPRAKSVGGEKPDLSFEKGAIIDAERNRISPISLDSPYRKARDGTEGGAASSGRLRLFLPRFFFLSPVNMCTHLRSNRVNLATKILPIILHPSSQNPIPTTR